MRLASKLIPLILCIGIGQSAWAWPKDEAELGAQNHGKFLAQQGGEIKDQALSQYVNRIGRKIVAQTPLAHEPWVFTVTDTPIVNAFAAPGGYVYLTRGLLALANTEAELAAVIGHEVAHLTARHHSKRQKRGNDANIGVLVGTVLGGLLGGKDGIKKGIELSSKVAAGYVGQFSQSQEFEADKLGTQYLAAAGYNPYAQSTILNSLGSKRAFEAKRVGRDYNPNRVDFFATHPATKDRVRRARDFASGLAGQGNQVDAEPEYLAAIDGLIYGDSPEQGFVRGRTFRHPVIGFEYSVPQNFTITNSARKVVAQGPNGAAFNLDGGGKASGTPASYLAQSWFPNIKQQLKDARLGEVRPYTYNGISGAAGIMSFSRKGEPWTAYLTVVEHRGRFIRFTGTVRESDRGLLRQFEQAARTFRALSDAEAAQLRPYRLRSYRTQPGDTVDWLSLASPSQLLRQEHFRTLNGMGGNQDVNPGDLVKVVTE